MAGASVAPVGVQLLELFLLLRIPSWTPESSDSKRTQKKKYCRSATSHVWAPATPFANGRCLACSAGAACMADRRAAREIPMRPTEFALDRVKRFVAKRTAHIFSRPRDRHVEE